MKEKHPSQDLTFEWGRRGPEELCEVSDALDAKAMAVFLAGSIIIGVVAGVGRMRVDGTLVPFILAFASYVVVVGLWFWAFRPQRLYAPHDPRALREGYWHLEPEETKREYWKHIEENFEHNLTSVNRRGRALQAAVPALFLEVVLLAVWLGLISFSRAG